MRKEYLDRSKLISLFIIGLLIGGLIGYIAGVSWALNWGVNRALEFAERQGINISLNSAMITAGLYQYKNNVGGCLFTDKNASLHIAERN